jgi:hypothetical protein
MKIIEVPIFNDDGSIVATHYFSPEEAQKLLQFAVNFTLAVGSTAIILKDQEMNNPQQELDFND